MNYRDSGCADCRALSSGDCGKHGLLVTRDQFVTEDFHDYVKRLEREREEDRQAIRALNADHVNRPHHLNACPMCIEHALAIQRATQPSA